MQISKKRKPQKRNTLNNTITFHSVGFTRIWVIVIIKIWSYIFASYYFNQWKAIYDDKKWIFNTFIPRKGNEMIAENAFPLTCIEQYDTLFPKTRQQKSRFCRIVLDTFYCPHWNEDDNKICNLNTSTFFFAKQSTLSVVPWPFLVFLFRWRKQCYEEHSSSF